MSRINRRKIIGGGIALAGAAASTVIADDRVACTTKTTSEWTESVDIVILGSGLAGCVSAITAYDTDPDTDVLVIEKMPEEYAGGNSRVAGQSLFFPSDLENLLKYRRGLDRPNPIPEDVLQVWGEAMVSQHDWVREKMAEAGISLVRHSYNAKTTAEYPELPGSDAANGRNFIPVPQTSGVWKAFKWQADQRPIRFYFNTPALELVQDQQTGEILGVIAERGGERIRIQARRAVIMCTGGFENNLDMQRNYGGLNEVFPLGTPGNTGDGIKMQQKVGADMWHMRNSVFTSGLYRAMRPQGFDSAFFCHTPRRAGSWLELGKEDRRFWNETRDWNATHFHRKEHGHWVDAPLPFVLPVHMIFDDQTRMQNRLGYGERRGMTWNNVVEHYIWSEDNSVEVEKGWIIKADSIEKLAEKLGRDPIRVRKAITEFNRAARNGSDELFGRTAASMAAIESPPYYAVEIVPGIICTTGGGKRNSHSQVVAHGGEPIKRLYSAGELGSIMGNLYQNGSFLTECIVFGRIAGRNAVRERRWTEGLSNRL